MLWSLSGSLWGDLAAIEDVDPGWLFALQLSLREKPKADRDERGRCALCGGPVGSDGRSLTPAPPEVAPRLPRAAARQVEEVDDDLTPVQRFERAIKRRDAATPPKPRRKGDKPAG